MPLKFEQHDGQFETVYPGLEHVYSDLGKHKIKRIQARSEEI